MTTSTTTTTAVASATSTTALVDAVGLDVAPIPEAERIQAIRDRHSDLLVELAEGGIVYEEMSGLVEGPERPVPITDAKIDEFGASQSETFSSQLLAKDRVSTLENTTWQAGLYHERLGLDPDTYSMFALDLTRGWCPDRLAE